jgi:hypothetical protein
MRALFLLLLTAATFAALPEGAGLAAKYPRDRGLARDAAVLLAEDFESGELSDLEKRWTEVSNKDGKVLAFDADQPATSGGRRALRIASTLGENTGGHLYTPLKRGLERAFARFYVKFAADAQPVHHFVHFGGYHPVSRWPQGGAGDRPRGDDRFTVGIEPYASRGKFPAPGAWHFYAYWSEMKVSAGGKYWGNAMPPIVPAPVPRERWQCVEVMVKCNSTPEKADGELALWLDGKLTNHLAPGTRRGPWTGMGFQPLSEGGEPFEGFRWRSHPELKVNFFWLLFYVTELAGRQAGTTPNPVNRVWFDDIVVASEYIGPTQP